MKSSHAGQDMKSCCPMLPSSTRPKTLYRSGVESSMRRSDGQPRRGITGKRQAADWLGDDIAV
jgi:hypothetical protein